MKHTLLTPVLVAGCLCALLPTGRAATELKIPNAGFEEQLNQWENQEDNGMSKVSAGAAHGGKVGLHVTDDSEERGSALYSQKISVNPGATYEVQFWGRVLSGSGIGVYLRFLGADGKSVSSSDEDKAAERTPVVNLDKNQGSWKLMSGQKTAPAGATSVVIFIHSYAKFMVTADVDDFVLSEVNK